MFKAHSCRSASTLKVGHIGVGLNFVACVQIKKSENQTRDLGRAKEDHVTFVKNHASSFTKIRSRRILNVKGSLLSFGTYWAFFRILMLCWKFTFILTVVIVIELAFVPFQQPRHCLLVYFGGNHKSRRFCYPVLLFSCDIRTFQKYFKSGFPHYFLLFFQQLFLFW